MSSEQKQGMTWSEKLKSFFGSKSSETQNAEEKAKQQETLSKDAAKEKLEQVATTVQESSEKAIESTKEMAADAKEKAKEAATTISEKTKEVVAGEGDAEQDKTTEGESWTQSLKEGIQQGVTTVSEKTSEGYTAAKEYIGGKDEDSKVSKDTDSNQKGVKGGA